MMVKRITHTAAIAAMILVPGYALAEDSSSPGSDSSGVYDPDDEGKIDVDVDREDVRGTDDPNDPDDEGRVDVDVNDDEDVTTPSHRQSGTVTQPAPGSTDVDVNVKNDNDTDRTPSSTPPAGTYRNDDVDRAPATTVNVYEDDDDVDEAKKPLGIALLVGGGVSDFANNAMRDATDPGGEWNVRATIGTRSIIGFEVLYAGAAQDMNSFGTGTSDATLYRNGVEGMLRLNIPITPGEKDNVLIEPYAMGGAGYTRFDVSGDAGTAAIGDGDDVLTVPYGGGLAIGVNHFMLDTRFTYRSTFEEDLVGEDIAGTANSDRDLDNWAANMLLGYEF